jgi:ATP-dependent Clp protease ATP-binding subunit ClpA
VVEFITTVYYQSASPDKAIDLMDEAASKNTHGNQF